MLLAQANLDAVPAGFLKWFLVVLVVFIVVIGIIVGIWSNVRRQSVAIEPQPVKVRVEPKRFSKDACDTRHMDIDRRLSGHDAEINSIWNTMRAEDAAIRKDTQDKFHSIMHSLGRIEGAIEREERNAND